MAAIITYCSAQRVARTQAETAQRTTERQIAHSLAQEAENKDRRRTALLLLLRLRVSVVQLALQTALTCLDSLLENSKRSADGSFIDTRNNRYVWNTFLELPSIREKGKFGEMTWQDLTDLQTVEQAAIHVLINAVDICDQSIQRSRMPIGSEDRLSVVQLEGTLSVVKQSIDGLKDIEDLFAKSVGALVSPRT